MLYFLLLSSSILYVVAFFFSNGCSVILLNTKNPGMPYEQTKYSLRLHQSNHPQFQLRGNAYTFKGVSLLKKGSTLKGKNLLSLRANSFLLE